MKKFLLTLFVIILLIHLTSGHPKRIKRAQNPLAELFEQAQVQIVTLTIQLSGLLKQLTGRDLTVIYS